jgi:thymidylate kinase
MLIGIVGPCGAGKSTLVEALKQYDYKVVHIAQEHSYVPYMWKRITNPDILIYLDVTYELAAQRRRLNWTENEYHNQVQRLGSAHDNADFYLHTDNLTPDEVLNRVRKFLDTIK